MLWCICGVRFRSQPPQSTWRWNWYGWLLSQSPCRKSSQFNLVTNWITATTLHSSGVELTILIYLLTDLLEFHFCILLSRQASIMLKKPGAQYVIHSAAGPNITSFQRHWPTGGLPNPFCSAVISMLDCAYVKECYYALSHLTGLCIIRSHQLNGISLSLILYIPFHLSALLMPYSSGAWYYSVYLLYSFHVKCDPSHKK